MHRRRSRRVGDKNKRVDIQCMYFSNHAFLRERPFDSEAGGGWHILVPNVGSDGSKDRIFPLCFFFFIFCRLYHK